MYPFEPEKGQRSHENQHASGCHATAVYVVNEGFDKWNMFNRV